MDSLFRVLEPVLGRNTEDSARQRRPFGSLLGQRTDWFRLYKDFFIPTDALNVHFLKHKLAVVCAKGFEIMDLTDLKGGSIPIFDPAKLRDKPALGDLQRRCEAAKPLGMFRSTETEFLLCYDCMSNQPVPSSYANHSLWYLCGPARRAEPRLPGYRMGGSPRQRGIPPAVPPARVVTIH